MAARAVGREIGEVVYVATSEAPRTVETAIAMGFAVDDMFPTDSGYVGTVGHHDQWSWPSPYIRYSELLNTDSVLAAVAFRELPGPRIVLLGATVSRAAEQDDVGMRDVVDQC